MEGSRIRVLVGWSRTGAVRVRYAKGSYAEASKEEFLRKPVLPAGAVVHVHVDAGIELVGRLVQLYSAGHLSALYVRSGLGHRTPLTPVTAATVRVWAEGVRAVPAHPVYRAVVPYAPAGSAACLTAVVARIFDPRWYFHPHKDSLSKLESAFGLEPRHDAKGRHWRRALVGCWCPIGGPPGTAPADFYGRYHAARLQLDKTPQAAERRVGRHFLKAVVAAWLDAFAAEAGRGGESMFDPAALFDRTAVDAVYNRRRAD